MDPGGGALKSQTAGWLLAAGLWLLCCAAPAAVAQDSAQEVRLLKAAFIYNFAKFTRWPDEVANNTSHPLHLCILGEDELVAELERLGGKTVQGRPLMIKSVQEVPARESCQILYVAASERQRYASTVEALRGEPVLTVSEIPHFGSTGGIIELFREEDRLRFIINLGVARESGLVLSSRLLRLAVVIGQGETP